MVEVLIPAIILTLGAGGAIVAFIVHERHAHPPAFARVPNAPINLFSSAPPSASYVPSREFADLSSAAHEATAVSLPALNSVPANLPQEVTTNLNAVHEFLAQLIVPVSTANMAAFQQVLASHKHIPSYRDALVYITNYFWKLAQDAGEPKRSQARVFILRDSTTSNVSTLANGFSMFSASLQQLEAFPKNLANLINCFNQFAAICERVWVLLNTPQLDQGILDLDKNEMRVVKPYDIAKDEARIVF